MKRHKIRIEELTNHVVKAVLAGSYSASDNEYKTLIMIVTLDPVMEKHQIRFEVEDHEKVIYSSASAIGLQHAIEEYNRV